MSVALTVIFILAAIILIIAMTFFLYEYNQKYTCEANPNYWCFNDWTCYNEQDENRKHPAKYLYCGHSADPNYCKDPANANHPACICNLAKGKNGCLPRECICEWSSGGTLNLGTCGHMYCNNGDTVNCESPPQN